MSARPSIMMGRQCSPSSSASRGATSGVCKCMSERSGMSGCGVRVEMPSLRLSCLLDDLLNPTGRQASGVRN
jgi:hypothetical protein